MQPSRYGHLWLGWFHDQCIVTCISGTDMGSKNELHFGVVLEAGCTAPQYEGIMMYFPRHGFCRWACLPLAELHIALLEEKDCNMKWRKLLDMWNFVDHWKARQVIWEWRKSAANIRY